MRAQLPQVVLAHASYLGRLAIGDRTQTLTLPSRCLDGPGKVVNGCSHTVDGVGVGIAAKDDDDVLAGRAVHLWRDLVEGAGEQRGRQ